MGDRWNDEMVDELFHGAPIANGLFDYIEFTRTLKHGAREAEESTQQVTTPTSPAPRTPTTPVGAAPTSPTRTAAAPGRPKKLSPLDINQYAFPPRH